MIRKVVSGGQTGVDRAALDCALKLDIEVGGWCPAGRRSEDGRIPDRYPLTETDSKNYAVRTRYNARDSDGTLIVSPLPLTGGTALTRSLAGSEDRPVLVVDLNDKNDSAPQFVEWIKLHKIETLNVAGPRASSDTTLYERSCKVLSHLLSAARNTEA